MHATEATLADLTRLLNSRTFDSADDLNAFLGEQLGSGSFSAPPPETPSERAQALIHTAWETKSPKRRIALAREALALSRDCVDAYVLLAEEAAATPMEARALLADGIEAGVRALGAELETLVQDRAMWLAHETRPYMRALAALATVCWAMGDRQAAIEQGWALLRLNPNDNQGIRYVLLDRLLFAGSVSEIERLLSLYPEESGAVWLYGHALHTYRLNGPSAPATAALRRARKANVYVLDYLLGRRPLPVDLPDYTGWGDESEAAAYVHDAMGLWFDAAGAMEWLEANAPAAKASGKPSTRRNARDAT